MKNVTASIVATLIIVIIGYVVIRDKNVGMSTVNKNNISTSQEQVINNGEIKNGIQYVTIIARGGYSPRLSFAKADVPTKLIIKTNGTYDCSASLIIRSLNYRNILPNTGETIIDAGIPKIGDRLQGVCAMGMYSFVIEFK